MRDSVALAARQIHRAISIWQGSDPAQVLVVTLDGGSGSGKSSIANTLAKTPGVSTIELDDFFAYKTTRNQWESYSAIEMPARLFDWDRLFRQVLDPITQGECATWYPVYFGDEQTDGTFTLDKRTPNTCDPGDLRVLVLEGSYSRLCPFQGCVNRHILVDVSQQERHARLERRPKCYDINKWHERWDPVESAYFTDSNKPLYDLIVKNEVVDD